MKSDVWSLGISLIELALGRFPFSEEDSGDSDLSDLEDLEGTLSPQRPGSICMPLPPARKREKSSSGQTSKKDKRKSKGVSLQGGGMTMSILELLQHIVNEPAPRLTPEGRFPKEAEEFVDSCLLKDPDERPTPKELLVSAIPMSPFRMYSNGFSETHLDRVFADGHYRSQSMGEHILDSRSPRLFPLAYPRIWDLLGATTSQFWVRDA